MYSRSDFHRGDRRAAVSRLAVGVLAFAGLLAGCTTAGRVHETRLDNGLKVIVKEDHRAPVVVSQVWYKVGAADEPDGRTGISHVLEHMMFKGTTRLKPGEFSRIIAENGGRENAFTGRDYTAYYQQLERSRLPISFELEADRMRNLVLDAGEFGKEVKVVMEERRLRTEDEPEHQVYEKFMAAAFAGHPYGHPVIGYMRDLEDLRPDAVRDWYRRFYAPNHATLVVVGDVRPAEVFGLAQRHFGALKAGARAVAPAPAAPRANAERRIRVRLPAEVPYLIMGFHTPVLGDPAVPAWEPYALEVLAGVLDGGNSARFARELVRGAQVAAEVGADYDLVSRYPSLFLVSGNPAKGRTVAALEAAIRRQLEAVTSAPVAEEELNRVKAQVVARDVYERDSVFYQAMKIGMLETVGLDWRRADEFVPGIRAVTAAQVQAVARKYFTDANLTVAILDPQPMKGAKPKRKPGGPHDDVR